MEEVPKIVEIIKRVSRGQPVIPYHLYKIKLSLPFQDCLRIKTLLEGLVNSVKSN